MITVRSASRPPVRGSVERGELGEHVGHLVAALAAADVDDHVGVAPLGDLLQQHGLAGAEAAGHGGAAAAGDREEQRRAPAGRSAAASAASSRSRHGPRPADRPASRPAARGAPPTVATGVGRPWYRPGGASRSTAPAAPGRDQHAVLDGAARPATVPSTSPAPTSLARASPRCGRTPTRPGPAGAGRRPAPARCRRSASGRSSPSKTPPSRPGPEPGRQRVARAAHRVAGRQAAGVLVGLHAWPGRRGARPPRRAAAAGRAPRARTSRRRRGPSTSTRGPLTRTTRPRLTATHSRSRPRGPAPSSRVLGQGRGASSSTDRRPRPARPAAVRRSSVSSRVRAEPRRGPRATSRARIAVQSGLVRAGRAPACAAWLRRSS